MFTERFTERSRPSMWGRIALFAVVAGMLPAGSVLAAESADTGDGLQEIIFPAQRTQSSLQETPVSITAFSAQELQERGFSSLLDISAFTPNLQVAARSGS